MKNVILVILVIAVVVVTALYVKTVGFGGKALPPPTGKKNNLHDVDCKKHGASGHGGSGKAVIQVYGSDPSVHTDDEGVFVCTGELVSWEPVAGSGITSIDVHFAQADWPFDPSNYQSTLHADSGNATTPQSVADIPAGFRMRAAKYTITVSTSGGPLPTLDPHVIPMGP